MMIQGLQKGDDVCILFSGSGSEIIRCKELGNCFRFIDFLIVPNDLERKRKNQQ